MIIQICVGSSCHLKGSPEIVELLQKAVEEHGLGNEVTLCGSFCVGKCNRVGVTVSKKLGKAHIRNRTRRRIREVYRLNEEKFQPGWDIVVVARTKAVDAPFEKLVRSYLNLARKAGILIEETE